MRQPGFLGMLKAVPGGTTSDHNRHWREQDSLTGKETERDPFVVLKGNFKDSWNR